MNKETRKKVLLSAVALLIFCLFFAGLLIGYHNGLSWNTITLDLIMVVCFLSAAKLFNLLRNGYFKRLQGRQEDRAWTALLFFLSLLPAFLAAAGYKLMGWF